MISSSDYSHHLRKPSLWDAQVEFQPGGVVALGPVSCSSRTEMIEDRKPLVCLLTDNDIHNTFCLRYWALDSTGKWNEPFDVLLSDSGLSRGEMMYMLKSACRVYLPRLRCETCGNPFQVGTRTEYLPLTGLLTRSGRRSRPRLCTSCGAAALAADREADLFALQQHRDRVAGALQRLHEKAKPVDYAKLSYVQSCLLYAALVAANVGQDDLVIRPLVSQTEPLAPTVELSDGIYTRLYADKLLLPALSSYPHALSLNEETGVVTLGVRTGTWTLTDDSTRRSTDEILSVLFQRLEHPEPQAAKELWYLVAEDECRRYFVSQCERYRFIDPGIYSSKVAATFRDYLDRCSIGQMWNIIYYAIKNLAALAQEGTYTRQHIYNMIPGSIRRYAEYRLAKDEPIRPWRRPSPATESWITSVLLDKVLKGGDISFETLTGQDVVGHVERMLDGLSEAPRM
jgi:hypothetical protein